jgi:hypothetical protein
LGVGERTGRRWAKVKLLRLMLKGEKGEISAEQIERARG